MVYLVSEKTWTRIDVCERVVPAGRVTRPEMLAVSATGAGIAGVFVGDADGRGVGVAVRPGVGEVVGLGVVVGVGVGAGVGVGVAERVGAGLAERVGVGAALALGVGVGVAGVGEADRVGDGVATAAISPGASGVSAYAAGAMSDEPTRVSPTTAVIQARSNDRAGARIVPPRAASRPAARVSGPAVQRGSASRWVSPIATWEFAASS
ncbi:hypothetical protein [Microbacterium testaceum]|uniref:hypothetical protein n=1 Tax=Microbacterium testaceum TaxID=2033 RepID=UPI00187D04CB|nr:hypothetical protein [Microbacterium testaceum]